MQISRERLLSQTHAWISRTGHLSVDELTTRYLPLLGEREASAFHMLIDESKRRDYLAAHALLRLTLERYFSIPIDGIRIAYEASGRPVLASPKVDGVSFSISHTLGLVACVVAYGRPCGIDVERLSIPRKVGLLANEVFAPNEHIILGECSGQDALDYFYTIWCLKEAYLKAKGMGISVDLTTIAFDFDEQHPVLVSGLGGDSRFFFVSQPVEPAHRLAVAAISDGIAKQISIYDLDLVRGGDPALIIESTL